MSRFEKLKKRASDKGHRMVVNSLEWAFGAILALLLLGGVAGAAIVYAVVREIDKEG